MPIFGSIVQKRKIGGLGGCGFVSALNKVDLPTFGRPTIPHLNPINIPFAVRLLLWVPWSHERGFESASRRLPGSAWAQIAPRKLSSQSLSVLEKSPSTWLVTRSLEPGCPMPSRARRNQSHMRLDGRKPLCPAKPPPRRIRNLLTANPVHRKTQRFGLE